MGGAGGRKNGTYAVAKKKKKMLMRENYPANMCYYLFVNLPDMVVHRVVDDGDLWHDCD